jgi:hypothetical protein
MSAYSTSLETADQNTQTIPASQQPVIESQVNGSKQPFWKHKFFKWALISVVGVLVAWYFMKGRAPNVEEVAGAAAVGATASTLLGGDGHVMDSFSDSIGGGGAGCGLERISVPKVDDIDINFDFDSL